MVFELELELEDGAVLELEPEFELELELVSVPELESELELGPVPLLKLALCCVAPLRAFLAACSSDDIRSTFVI